MTDRIVPAATVSSPYYDDFDEDKHFLRELFRPGFSVQARELTQAQTILQKQIDRFGTSIYQNGSIVTGAQTFLDTNVVAIKLQDNYAGQTVNVNNFLNQVISDINFPNVRGRVVAVVDKLSNGADPKTLIVSLQGKASFADGATIGVVGSTIFATLITSQASWPSSIAKLNEGVFFVNGYFMKADEQIIVLDKYDASPTFRIGLQINDSIVTEGSDTSLLDPALESSNYQAPGATRYQVNLIWSSRSIDSTDDSKFIELMRVEDGVLINQVVYPQYSELEDTLARRTFDQSGSYTVKPFKILLKNHIGDYLTGFANAANNSTAVVGFQSNFSAQVANTDFLLYNGQTLGVSVVTDDTHITTSNVTNAPIPNLSLLKVVKPSRYTIQLDPGVAYVKGYEFRTISPRYITANLGRDQSTTNNFSILLDYGNYFTGNNANGFIDTVSTPIIVDLHNAYSSVVQTGTFYANTKIGTARVISVDWTSGLGNARLWTVHVYDERFTVNNATWSNVNCISVDSSKSATIDVSNVSKFGSNAANQTFLTDPTFDSFVFNFPQNAIVPGTITGANYTDKASFLAQPMTAVANVATSPTLTLGGGQNFFGTGVLPQATTQADFYVVVTANLTSNLATGQILDYSNNNLRITVVSPTNATVTATANASFTAAIMALVNQATASPKTKTLVTPNTSFVLAPNVFGGLAVVNGPRVAANLGQVQFSAGFISNSNVWLSLYLSDVANVRILQNCNVASDINSTNDVTSSFQFDTGQRDQIYDFGAIKLNQGATPPTGNVIVLANYYTHAGTGFCTVDSYPNAANTGYTSIPQFRSPSTGDLFNLRDCVDFRPRRRDANTGVLADLTTTPAFTLDNAKLFVPESNFNVSGFGYYLNRIDKVILTKDRQLKIMQNSFSDACTTSR